MSVWFVGRDKDVTLFMCHLSMCLLTCATCTCVKVCGEETMKEILDRYLTYNSHAGSYTWKYDGRNLDMGMTLENLIPDEDEEFYKLGMSDDLNLQAIHLYFNDDLTEM